MMEASEGALGKDGSGSYYLLLNWVNISCILIMDKKRNALLKSFRKRLELPLPQNPTTARQSIKEDAYVDIDVSIKNQNEEEYIPQALPDVEEEEDFPDDQENKEPEQRPTAPEPATAASSPAAPHDPNGRMPGQLPTATEVLQNDYHSIKQRGLAKVAAMVGQEVTIIESIVPNADDILPKSNQGVEYGLRGFESHKVLSSITSNDFDGKVIIRQLEDANQQLHFLVKYELMTDLSGRKHTKAIQIEGIGWKDIMYY
jgi:hypothetical protein